MTRFLARIVCRMLAGLARLAGPPPRSAHMVLSEAVVLGIRQGKVFLTVQQGAQICEAQIPPQYARELGVAMMRAADLAESGAQVSETIQ